MLKRNGLLLATVVACAVVAGCSVRLGGPKPEEYNAIGLHAPAGASAGEIATRIKGAEGDVVLLAADRDSAWFADVATQTAMKVSGPGRTGPSSLAFLTRLELLGDTALILTVPNGGGRLHVQDALFRVDKDRTLDLMLVSFAEAASVREGVRAMLNYIATDVGGTAAVVTPVGSLKWRGGEVGTGDETGPVTKQVRQALVDIQYGRAEDTFGWLHRVL